MFILFIAIGSRGFTGFERWVEVHGSRVMKIVLKHLWFSFCKVLASPSHDVPEAKRRTLLEHAEEWL